MFLQIIIQYYTTYQAVQFFCIKQEKVVINTHKHLPYYQSNNIWHESQTIGSIFKPWPKQQTIQWSLDRLNTKLVHYSDPHYILIKIPNGHSSELI